MGRKCIGYKDTQGKCNNDAGAKLGPLWCDDCNKVRIENIDKQMESMLTGFESDKKEIER